MTSGNHRTIDLATARVLISNDDGIDAPGLKILENIIRERAAEVWVIAPETEQSATSHSLTLRRPLRIRKRHQFSYAVDGTPTDSVLLGINKIMKNNPPDLVLSGINRGGNLGEDVTYSGTVAAAMEGTLLGVPSIALSQVYSGNRSVNWSVAEHWITPVLDKLKTFNWFPGILLNVNFPAVDVDQVTGIEVVSQGRRKIGADFCEAMDPRGEPYYWIGPQRDEDVSAAGTDLECVMRGGVAVTPLSMDLTDKPSMEKLKTVFS